MPIGIIVQQPREEEQEEAITIPKTEDKVQSPKPNIAWQKLDL